MNNYTKTRKKFLILLTTAAFLTTGCSTAKPIPIVTINDKDLYMEDFLYDIYEVEMEGNQQETYYQEHLGYSYWDYDYSGSTMREIAKNSIIASVVMYEILSDQASKEGMTLSAMEQSEVEDKTDKLISASSEDFLNGIGLTRKVIQQSISKKLLGDNYRIELLKNFQIDEKAIRNTIKPEDYREYQTECLFIPTVQTENQTLLPLSQEEIDAAYATISEALQKLNKGEGFDGLLNDYDNLEYITRDFIQGDVFCEQEYQEASMLLQNNTYSQIITTNYGYYIIHMLDNNSTEKYEQAVEQAINAKEDDQFTTVYNELKKQYDIAINFEYWDTLTIGSITTSEK